MILGNEPKRGGGSISQILSFEKEYCIQLKLKMLVGVIKYISVCLSVVMRDGF